MELFNQFFTSFEVQKGPLIFYLDKIMIGKITLIPSKKNFFVKNPSLCFMYERGQIELSESLNKFLNYSGIPFVEMEKVCLSIWQEELDSDHVFIKKNSDIISDYGPNL